MYRIVEIAAELLERGFALMDPDHLPKGFEHYGDIEALARDRRLGLSAEDLPTG